MNNIHSPYEVNLFSTNCDKYNSANSLKTFINYLRFQGQTGVLDFSNTYKDGLHLNLSISKNLMIEISSDRLFESGSNPLENKIKHVENKQLIELIIMLDDTNRDVSELNYKEKTLVSIIKSLLTSSEYIFLEIEEDLFNKSELRLIKEAITYEVITYSRKIFISSQKEENWSDIATHLTTVDENCNYSTKSNPISILNSNYSIEKVRPITNMVKLKQVI